MKKIRSLIILAFVLVFVLNSCKKQSETFNTASLNDYYPLQTGKTFLYRLDSTVPASFGTALIVRSYQAQDSIESTFTDNQGRLSYRIFRLVRDTAGTQPWVFAATYFATPTAESVEYVDNNLRFIKLHQPFIEGYTWPGNSYIDTKSVDLSYLDGWDYQYQNVGQSYNVLGKNYDSTVTVLQQDDTTPLGPFNPNNYQQRNLSTEVYAKGVGLVYKEFLHWTWNISSSAVGYEDDSYGVKLRLISYN